MQIARVVEPEDDSVLVVLRDAGAEHLRAEVSRKRIRGSENSGDPLFELLLASQRPTFTRRDATAVTGGSSSWEEFR